MFKTLISIQCTTRERTSASQVYFYYRLASFVFLLEYKSQQGRTRVIEGGGGGAYSYIQILAD